jgi:20S proteasome alpha/beta subunit
MTVGIVAICNTGLPGGQSDERIVICTDWRISTQLGSSDTLYKLASVTPHFRCVFAGDPSEAKAVISRLQRIFRAAEVVDETNILTLVRSALYEQRAEKRNALAQTRYGMDHDDVLKVGKERLPSENFARYLDAAAAVRLDTEFIVAGFGDSDNYIVETDFACKVGFSGDFACIGDGEHLARASLIARRLQDITLLNNALYYIYEAKKAAERVNSVGRSTLLTVLTNDGGDRAVLAGRYDVFDGMYRKYGPRNVPSDLEIEENVFEGS